jgi:aminoglycoside N3'-acetyltransferase
MMGMLPQALIGEVDSIRTTHPILSFAGIRAEKYLRAQTMDDPLAPIGALADDNGWTVLINVDNTSNTSIHYGEKLAERKQFVRWALLPDRIVECPAYAGDSSGFNQIDEYILPITRHVVMDNGAFVQAIPLKKLFEVTVDLIKKNPLALLCQRIDCEMCNAVRNT